MDNLKKNNCLNLFLIKIRPYFYKNDEFWKNNLLKKHLDKWNKIAKKLVNRENILEKVLDYLEKYMLNNDVDTMANVQILKKFLHDYPLIRALGFLRKLKDIA
jgi:predicted patatin/cPLA2 family phospholipase